MRFAGKIIDASEFTESIIISGDKVLIGNRIDILGGLRVID